MDAGRIEVGHQRRYEGVVRLMRHGGGFGAVVVAGQTQHAAVLGRARGIAMAEHVAAAVDAGTLAVPDADHAIMVGAGRQIELLRAPDRGGREVLVHAGLELDVVLFEMFSRGEQLLVVAAQRRTAIAGDKARGVETGGAVPADLRHRQANQRLDPGHEDVTGALGVFLIETDRTLIDSHSALFKKPGRPLAAGLFYVVVQIVRTSLCRFSQATHQKSGQWRPAPADRNFVPGIPGWYFGLCRYGAWVRNAVARSFSPVLRYKTVGRSVGARTIFRDAGDSAGAAFVHCVSRRPRRRPRLPPKPSRTARR